MKNPEILPHQGHIEPVPVQPQQLLDVGRIDGYRPAGSLAIAWTFSPMTSSGNKVLTVNSPSSTGTTRARCSIAWVYFLFAKRKSTCPRPSAANYDTISWVLKSCFS